MEASIDTEKEEIAAILRGSLIEFCKTFFPLLTGRPFIVSTPIGRESHHIIIARALTRAHRLQLPTQRLIINVPPGHSKSVMVSLWIAWCMTHNPDSNFLYISYSKVIASKHTAFIKQIMSSAHYKYLFDIHIRYDSKAKDLFRTEQGGSIGAFGASSSITGQDAGLPGLDRFSGAIIIDDAHKPDEAASDTIRASVIDNFNETIAQRARGYNVPFVFIGQRVHEDDLANYLIEGKDGYEWEKIILKSLDAAGNALYPEAIDKEALLIKQATNPYVFSSQFQQEPVPAGGALFKPEWFVQLDEEPNLLLTFICADTAETDKSWNDATVFSFFGLYEVETMGRKTGQLAIHWLDCLEIRIEPKDLSGAFLDFYADCTRHKVAPLIAAIEKKSTGVTLVSVLKGMRGLTIREVERTVASGSKSQRFINMQSTISSGLVSFTRGARHVDTCIEHMSKITANDTHRHDDIADTLSDAVRLALIEKTLYSITNIDDKRSEKLSALNDSFKRKVALGKIRNDPSRKTIF